MKPIKYKKCLVAFVDVMGFQSLLVDNDKNRQKLTTYFSAINEIREAEGVLNDIKILAVSDSIIYSLELEDDDYLGENYQRLVEFINEIARLQFRLALEQNIWTRGAISAGPLYMSTSDNIIVGQSYVDAFNLERRADFARIVIDPKLLKEFRQQPHNLARKLIESKCPILDFKLTDDFIQIDWLGVALNTKQVSVKAALRRHNFFKDFFVDLKERRSQNHELYLKSQKLLSYLVRSGRNYMASGKEIAPHAKIILEKLEVYSGEELIPFNEHDLY